MARPLKKKKVESGVSGVRRAFGYCRVSTTDQVDGQSLAVQRERIAGICAANGWELVETVEERGVSGSMPFRSREAAARLWAQLQPGDVIVALRLDRAFRNTSDALDVLAECKRRGIGLVVGDLSMQDCTAGAVAEMVFTMLAGVAAFERSRLRERLADGREAKVAKGGHIGGDAPFGYRVVGEGKAAMLEPDMELQGYVLARHARGEPSRTIVNWLRLERGVATTANTICKFVREHAPAA